MPDDPNKGKDDLDLTNNKEFMELSKMVRGLGLLVQQGQKAQSKLQESIEGLVKTVSESGTAPRKGASDDDDPNSDAINELDNAGLVKVILSEVGKVLDKKVGDLDKTIADTRTSLTKKELQAEYKRLSENEETPDFKEWGDEMAALSKQHPTLSLEDLYHKARREDATKAAELDLKYKKTDDKSGGKSPKFMGLFPTSGPGEVGDKEKKLTTKEAEDKAWEETVSQFPALSTSGDE